MAHGSITGITSGRSVSPTVIKPITEPLRVKRSKSPMSGTTKSPIPTACKGLIIIGTSRKYEQHLVRWTMLYLNTRRVISIEPLHGVSKMKRFHVGMIPNYQGGNEREVFGSDLPHGDMDGSCRQSQCDIVVTTMLVQQLIMLGVEYCAPRGSIRACDVLDEDGYIPPLLRSQQKWTHFLGFANLAKTGFERNAYVKEWDNYKALQLQMQRTTRGMYGHLQAAPEQGFPAYEPLSGDALLTA
ncbi:hypothetical protein IAT40_000493 [Kwoniella sp. CBS 6097]